MFVAREDKEFLWTWARELEDGNGIKVTPDHILSVLVSQLRALRAQGQLFPELTEIEARALSVARAEWDASVEAIAAHAREHEEARRQLRADQARRGPLPAKARKAA